MRQGETWLGWRVEQGCSGGLRAEVALGLWRSVYSQVSWCCLGARWAAVLRCLKLLQCHSVAFEGCSSSSGEYLWISRELTDSRRWLFDSQRSFSRC